MNTTITITMQAAALRYSAERLRATGEVGTIAAAQLLEQLAEDDEHDRTGGYDPYCASNPCGCECHPTRDRQVGA